MAKILFIFHLLFCVAPFSGKSGNLDKLENSNGQKSKKTRGFVMQGELCIF